MKKNSNRQTSPKNSSTTISEYIDALKDNISSSVALASQSWNRRRNTSVNSMNNQIGTLWKGKARRRFVVTTMFLRRAMAHVTPDRMESLSYISGITGDNVSVLQEIVAFDMNERSEVFVSGDIVSSTEALIKLSDDGFQLLGTVHSHPGSGAAATTPSQIDHSHHRSLELGGFEALGIIVTRDGYVRFYSTKMPFLVEVIGNDGKWIQANKVYQLSPSPRRPSLKLEPHPKKKKKTHEQGKLPSHNTAFRVTTTPMLAGCHIKEVPTDRQERLKGFDQATVTRTGIISCGAGGLAAEQGVAIVRKGYKRFACFDPDEFDATNFARQRCFAKDLHQNKAIGFAENLAKEAILETEILGLGVDYDEARELVNWNDYQVALCNVDNDPTRIAMARDMFKKGIPLVLSGVTEDALSGYVFVQESKPGTACFGCAFPEKIDSERHPCPNTPASIDILKAIGGHVTYAIDTLVMPRPRHWNYRVVHLSGFLEDAASNVQPRHDCPICGGKPTNGRGGRNE